VNSFKTLDVYIKEENKILKIILFLFLKQIMSVSRHRKIILFLNIGHK